VHPQITKPLELGEENIFKVFRTEKAKIGTALILIRL